MLYGVSVGPGDPELITLKAARVLKSCTVLAVPRSGTDKTPVALEIARKGIPEIAGKRVVELPLPMTRNEADLERARDAAASTLIFLLKAGEEVAFLTLGDASVYSTYMYLHDRVRAAGCEAQIIPGVPSFCAAAALRGKRLTEPGKPLHIVPGSYDGVEASLNWPGTKILMKSGKALGKVKALLEARGLLERATLVQECGMEGERVRPFSEVGEAGYFSIVFVEEAE